MIKKYLSRTLDAAARFSIKARKSFQQAKQQPFLYGGMFYVILWGFLTTIIGGFQLSFYVGFTGVYLLIFGITKWTAYEQYKIIQTFGNKQAAKEIEWLVTRRIAVVAAIMSFMHFSFIIAVTFFHEENPANYSEWLIYFFGGMAAANILIAVTHAVRAVKNKSNIFKCIRLIDLSNILISISLSQRAILYYAEFPYAKLVTAIGGIFFSLCAFGVCLLMFKRSRVTRISFNRRCDTSTRTS